MFRLKRRGCESSPENPLIPVVRQFDDRTRRALYAAANSGTLKRRTWRGCAFNRAADVLGRSVTNKSQAAEVFTLAPALVVEFIDTWDSLRGSDKHCTALLRDGGPRPAYGEVAHHATAPVG
jgi:hypothetical protein